MYFKENKYLAKVNHIIYKSNIEYTLSESEINDLKEEGDILIKQFTEGEIDFLFNYGVLTTGFDAPKTRNIVIGLMSIFWTQKVKLFYAALLANNSH